MANATDAMVTLGKHAMDGVDLTSHDDRSKDGEKKKRSKKDGKESKEEKRLRKEEKKRRKEQKKAQKGENGEKQKEGKDSASGKKDSKKDGKDYKNKENSKEQIVNHGIHNEDACDSGNSEDHNDVSTIKVQLPDSLSGQKLEPVMSFSAAGFTPELAKAGCLQRFSQPTPIQSNSWPYLMKGHDVIGIAETGSGKTLAFGLPALHHLLLLQQQQQQQQSSDKGSKKSSKERASTVNYLCEA